MIEKKVQTRQTYDQIKNVWSKLTVMLLNIFILKLNN